MDRVFSVDEIPDHFWSPPIPTTGVDGGSSNMSRSHSEWAFQRFLQEASAASPPSASSAADDVAFVEIQGQHKSSTGVAAAPTPVNGGVLSDGPPNAPVDSDEYRAYLKNKLNEACAAVAMTRVFLFCLFPFCVVQCDLIQFCLDFDFGSVLLCDSYCLIRLLGLWVLFNHWLSFLT